MGRKRFPRCLVEVPQSRRDDRCRPLGDTDPFPVPNPLPGLVAEDDLDEVLVDMSAEPEAGRLRHNPHLFLRSYGGDHGREKHFLACHDRPGADDGREHGGHENHGEYDEKHFPHDASPFVSRLLG